MTRQEYLLREDVVPGWFFAFVFAPCGVSARSCFVVGQVVLRLLVVYCSRATAVRYWIIWTQAISAKYNQEAINRKDLFLLLVSFTVVVPLKMAVLSGALRTHRQGETGIPRRQKAFELQVPKSNKINTRTAAASRGICTASSWHISCAVHIIYMC